MANKFAYFVENSYICVAMRKGKAHRVTITVPEAVWSRVSANAQRHKFRSSGELVRTVLKVVTEAMDKAWRMEAEVDNEVMDMFQLFSYWEPQPDGTVPKKPRRRKEEMEL